MSHLIEFDKLPWSESGKGVRSKVFVHENQQIRLAEFSEDFVEPDWCGKGHTITVLEGKFSIDYSGKLERYKAGDVIFIPKGEESRHKAILGKGEEVLLLLFEIIE